MGEVAQAVKFIITEMNIDRLVRTWGDGKHPERTPVGPFDSREEAWDYAHAMQKKYGSGGGSVEVSPLYEPEDLT